MTAFEMTDSLFSQYMKQETMNDFLQNPIMLKDLIEEVRKQIHIHETKK
jgi:hypothetical protein